MKLIKRLLLPLLLMFNTAALSVNLPDKLSSLDLTPTDKLIITYAVVSMAYTTNALAGKAWEEVKSIPDKIWANPRNTAVVVLIAGTFYYLNNND